MQKVQEISLYMGQEYYDFTYCQNEEEEKAVLASKPKTLTGSSLATHYAGSIIGRDVSNFKLLLRPLATITEEEAIHLGFVPTSRRTATKWFLRALEVNALGVWTADEFQYLLSKGFDLFGFIESGKALDKTKV